MRAWLAPVDTDGRKTPESAGRALAEVQRTHGDAMLRLRDRFLELLEA